MLYAVACLSRVAAAGGGSISACMGHTRSGESGANTRLAHGPCGCVPWPCLFSTAVAQALVPSCSCLHLRKNLQPAPWPRSSGATPLATSYYAESAILVECNYLVNSDLELLLWLLDLNLQQRAM